jgi:hypothetical protein
MKRKAYEIWTYDVWGNAEDGYEVNDRYNQERQAVMEIPPRTYNQGTESQFTCFTPSDKQILAFLKEYGILKETCTLDDIEIDGTDKSFYARESKDGYPLCEVLEVCDRCDEQGFPVND